jgi:hypothetical protein
MNNRELSASWILLANSKSSNFNGFRSGYLNQATEHWDVGTVPRA